MNGGTNWTKESALRVLEDLAKATESLANERRFSAKHTRWVANTTSVLEEVFGRDSVYYVSFTDLPWEREGSFTVGGIERPEETINPELGLERVHQEAYRRQLGTSRGLLLAAKDELERKNLDSVYKGKDTGPEASTLLKIINLAEHKLRKTIRATPQREQEVQEAFENLLIGASVSYSRETERIEYSAKTYTPDFTIAKSDLAIEIKLCGRDGREKQIIAEINDDILAYRTKYGNVIFIIYDVGLIRDVERFTNKFEEQEGVIVKVVKH